VILNIHLDFSIGQYTSLHRSSRYVSAWPHRETRCFRLRVCRRWLRVLDYPFMVGVEVTARLFDAKPHRNMGSHAQNPHRPLPYVIGRQSGCCRQAVAPAIPTLLQLPQIVLITRRKNASWGYLDSAVAILVCGLWVCLNRGGCGDGSTVQAYWQYRSVSRLGCAVVPFNVNVLWFGGYRGCVRTVVLVIPLDASRLIVGAASAVHAYFAGQNLVHSIGWDIVDDFSRSMSLPAQMLIRWFPNYYDLSNVGFIFPWSI